MSISKKLAFLGLVLGLLSCKTEAQKTEGVRLGHLIWSEGNLNTKVFRNGDSILIARSNADWMNAHQAKQPAMIYYNFDESLDSLHGPLYNVWAVKDSRGLIPQGWRLPAKADIDSMIVDRRVPYMAAVPGNTIDGTGPWTNASYTFLKERDTCQFRAWPSGDLAGYTEVLDRLDFGSWGNRIVWWLSDTVPPNPDHLAFWTLYNTRGAFHINAGGTRGDHPSGHYIRMLKQ